MKRLLDFRVLVPRRTRLPVPRPKLIEDRPADAEARIGLELDIARLVEFLEGRDQADDPHVGEVAALGHVLGHLAGDPVDDAFDKRGVFQDQIVPFLLFHVIPYRRSFSTIDFQKNFKLPESQKSGGSLQSLRAMDCRHLLALESG